MKKIISIAFVLLVLSIYTTAIHAEEIVDNGNCGENLTWTFDTNGTLTVEGIGEMINFESNIDTPWRSHYNEIERIVIEDDVTSIGDYAFSYCRNLKTVDMPNSITRIGVCGFSGCSGITNITIPDSVKIIDKWVFSSCSNLTSIVIPDGATTIGEGAFEHCFNLSDITLPASIIEIGNDAFYSTAYYNDKSNWEDGVLYINSCLIKAHDYNNGVFYEEYSVKQGTTIIADYAFAVCRNISNITISDSVKYIGEAAFMSCDSLEKISIPEGVNFISDSLCGYCQKLSQVVLPYTISYIGNEAFAGCANLSDITIPNSVNAIGEIAFYYCTSLSDITIPKSVTEIGKKAFSGCQILNITVEEDNLYYCDIDGVLFNKAKTDLITYAKDGIQPKYTVPEGVTNISYNAFESCKKITDIVLPDSIMNIGNEAFLGCENLVNINIPNGITYIGIEVFAYCSSLTNITIPNSVTYIDDGAFRSCVNLTNIFISKNITYIEQWAFAICGNLKNIYYGGTESNWKNIEVVDDMNDSFINATLHFNATEIPQASIKSATISQSENNYVFNISLENISHECYLLTALYDDGSMTGVKVTEISADNIPDSFTITADSADSAKVFLWDGLENMSPLCEAVDAEFQ